MKIKMKMIKGKFIPMCRNCRECHYQDEDCILKKSKKDGVEE